MSSNESGKNLKVALYPLFSDTNTYVNLFTRELTSRGVSLIPVSQVFQKVSGKKDVSVVHLNWWETMPETPVADFFKRALKILILRRSGVPIVWTLHNRKPHDIKWSILRSWLMQIQARSASAIVIHSRSSVDLLTRYYGKNVSAKARYIPHPNYINAYGPIVKPDTELTQSKTLKLLFIGTVQPYKNIELLIETVSSFRSEEVELIIAGKPINRAYQDQITSSVNPAKNNIKFILRFIQDNEIAEIIANCDLLVLPYNMESSLNSGTVILAFSYQKTVICPEIGTIKDFDGDENILSYTYNSNEHHAKELKRFIQRSIDIKNNNPTVFDQMGNNMFQKVSKMNDIKSCTDQLLTVYNSVQ